MTPGGRKCKRENIHTKEDRFYADHRQYSISQIFVRLNKTLNMVGAAWSSPEFFINSWSSQGPISQVYPCVWCTVTNDATGWVTTVCTFIMSFRCGCTINLLSGLSRHHHFNVAMFKALFKPKNETKYWVGLMGRTLIIHVNPAFRCPII